MPWPGPFTAAHTVRNLSPITEGVTQVQTQPNVNYGTGMPWAVLPSGTMSEVMRTAPCPCRLPAGSRWASWRCCGPLGTSCASTGCCDRCVDEIAARAGVCRRMVQAVREAARLGLATVEERRREGRRNLPNVVGIVSREWTTWLAKGGRSIRPKPEPLIGCRKVHPRTRALKTSARARQNRSLLPEGSRPLRQCNIGPTQLARGDPQFTQSSLFGLDLR
jgi:hypothetical protein